MKLERQSRRGAALMLALWALFLLSAMIIGWALEINSRITVAGVANRGLEAEALACSGAEVALHPGVVAGSSLLDGSLGTNGTYHAVMSGEGGRLNLSWLLAGENPVRLEILRKYLENRGVDLNERDRMIDCLLDWVDPDDLVRLNGEEARDDYQPANAPLTSLEDLKKVRGWEAFTSQPDWDADFTLVSSGAIDLTWASRDVLLALPGVSEAQVDRFLLLRRGPDGVDGTDDDAEFKTGDEVRSALGFTSEQWKHLAGLITFKDPIMRVISVGKSGDVTRTVRMVLRKGGNGAQLISWKEL